MTLPDPLGLVGAKLGPYVVREQLTEGGVAVIYRGEHESLQSSVAVKVLIPELVLPDVRPTLEQMFLREAQILSQLRSEDILRALDHGRVVCPADGIERPYIVVDFLKGRPLSDDLEQRAAEIPKRPYTLSEAVDVLSPIARALSVCHASGIIHRDVNPRNVFLEDTGEGANARAKLIDFGFAKEVYRTEALRLENVEGTLFARSPDYASPEHYDREKYGELSETTDTYTLALMLVEMLTLERPLRGITDTDLFLATTDENDRPTPNNRGARVPANVEALFAQAVATDQLKRPQRLLDWWDQLTAAVMSSPAAIPDPSHFEEPTARRRLDSLRAPSPKPPNRGRKGAWLGLALLLMAAAAGAAYWRTRPLDCPKGFADCNGQHGDGCETPIDRDPASCGVCGNSCGHSSGVACVQGHCAVTTCPEGFKDCNATVADGCETDVRADTANCGDCTRRCNGEGAKTATCTAGKCELTCKPGLVDCNTDGADGCETSVLKDPKNCGHCGVACSGACVEGLCAPKILVSGVQTTHIAARSGVLYYFDETDHAIRRVSADEKPATVVPKLTELTGMTIVGERVVWAGRSGVFARLLGDANATPERIYGGQLSDTPLVEFVGTLAWAVRAPPTASVAPAPHRAAKHAAVGGDRRRVAFKSFAQGSSVATVECNEWPRTFGAEGGDVYCCDETTPLASVTCQGGTTCTHHDLPIACPEELSMTAAFLYLAADVRILAVNRATNVVTVLAKRKRHPRNVTSDGRHIYWTEADDIYRLDMDAHPPAAELIARRQQGIAALVTDDTAVYWVARDKDAASVYALQGP